MLVRPISAPVQNPLGDPLRGSSLPWEPAGGGGAFTAPVNTVAPVASGTVTIGGTLSTTNGTWTGTPPPTFTYQWRRDGVSIGGATASTYTPVAADIGPAIDCLVTATNAAAPAGVSADSNNLTWSLSQFTSLVAWYRADLGVTESGGEVSAWADQSGRGNTLSSTGAGAGPTYNATDADFGNRPSIEGNGTSTWLRDTAVNFGGVLGPAFTVGMIVKLITNNNGDTPWSYNNAGLRVGELTTSRFGLSGTGGGGTVASTSSFTAAARQALFYGTGTQFELRVNDASEGTPQSYTGNVADGLAMGLFASSTGAGFSAVKYAELFVMRAAISASERADWDAWAANRYGV